MKGRPHSHSTIRILFFEQGSFPENPDGALIISDGVTFYSKNLRKKREK
jgi:hypothetical protein